MIIRCQHGYGGPGRMLLPQIRHGNALGSDTGLGAIVQGNGTECPNRFGTQLPPEKGAHFRRCFQAQLRAMPPSSLTRKQLQIYHVFYACCFRELV